MRDTLAIARQVAEALEVAHGRGVIHRDLKPANIKLTPDGQVKVLDFGLAKALEPAAAGVEPTATVTAPVELTDAGRVMGTVAYMSPEQASARPVDQRTDLWAFGCVVYEMLTGTRAFEGDTTTEVLVRVLEREPDWSALPPATPEIVRSLLRQCLAKDPRCRLHHAADARLQLDDALARPSAGDAATGLPRRARSRVLLAGAAGGLLVAATLVGSATRCSNTISSPRTNRIAAHANAERISSVGIGAALHLRPVVMPRLTVSLRIIPVIVALVFQAGQAQPPVNGAVANSARNGAMPTDGPVIEAREAARRKDRLRLAAAKAAAQAAQHPLLPCEYWDLASA